MGKIEISNDRLRIIGSLLVVANILAVVVLVVLMITT